MMIADQDILEALAHPDEPQTWLAGKHGGLRTGPSIRERLLAGMRYEGDCWIITAQPSQRYPSISIQNHRLSRHRVMFYLTHGRWPLGGETRHTCDRKRCINPAHLIEGTRRDNADDALERGRYWTGPRKTHCLNGHLRSAENIYAGGTCKQCATDRSMARYRARKEKK